MNAFLTKFLLFAPLVGITLPIFSGISTADAILAALLAAAASFLTADLVIYPRYGNIAAAISDAVIATIIIIEFFLLADKPLSLPGLSLLAGLIAAGEWFYHPYLGRTLFSKRRK